MRLVINAASKSVLGTERKGWRQLAFLQRVDSCPHGLGAPLYLVPKCSHNLRCVASLKEQKPQPMGKDG